MVFPATAHARLVGYEVGHEHRCHPFLAPTVRRPLRQRPAAHRRGGHCRPCGPGPDQPPCRPRGSPRLRRTYGVAPVRQARPLTPADLRQILSQVDRSTPLGARDAAIILLGYASALRRSELVALTLDDVEPKPGGLLLHLRSSKTDQDAERAVVGVAHGNHAISDPIEAIAAWRSHGGEAPGPLFTRLF